MLPDRRELLVPPALHGLGVGLPGPPQWPLRAWTGQELTHRGQPSLAELFLITALSPVDTPPEQLFFLPVWHQPGARLPVSLLDPLPGQPLRETLFEGS